MIGLLADLTLLCQSCEMTQRLNDHIGYDLVWIWSIDLVLLGNTTHDQQCPYARVETEFDISQQVVSDHQCLFGVELVSFISVSFMFLPSACVLRCGWDLLGDDGVHHCSVWFTDYRW